MPKPLVSCLPTTQPTQQTYFVPAHCSCYLECVSCSSEDACGWPQERHWKRAAACGVAHQVAAASRRSLLKHTSAMDVELQSCQDKVIAPPGVLIGPASKAAMSYLIGRPGPRSQVRVFSWHVPASTEREWNMLASCWNHAGHMHAYLLAVLCLQT